MPACSTTPSPEQPSTSRRPELISVRARPTERPPFGTNLGRILRAAHVLVAVIGGKTVVFTDKG